MIKGWRECKLGDVAEVIGGGTPKTSVSEYWNGDIPWLTPRDLTGYNKVYISYGERLITEEGLKNSSAKIMPKGTVLLTSRAPIGYIAIAKNKICTNQGFKSLVPNFEILNSEFLYYWLKSNTDYLQQLGTGTTFAEIPGSVVKDVDISLPPLQEQKAIAEILSSLDDKIDLLHRQNQTLESIAQTLFRQWFIQDAKPEWEEKPLGEIANITIGRTPPRKEEKWFSISPEDVKWISIKDLGNDGAFIFKTSEYLTQEAVERFNIPVIPKDMVVLSFKMTVGRVAITTEEMLSNEAIAHFKFYDKTPISKEYLYLFLKNFPYESLGSTSTIVTAINSSMIKEILILIPDEKIMKDFSSIVELQFKKIRQNQKQIQTLENLRDTLLPKLISGEVRIKI